METKNSISILFVVRKHEYHKKNILVSVKLNPLTAEILVRSVLKNHMVCMTEVCF